MEKAIHIFQWIIAVALVVLLMAGAISNEEISVPIGVIFSVLILAFSFWQHKAIVSRNVDQITLLTILNLVPLSNIVGCLIMLSIRRVTKIELEKYE